MDPCAPGASPRQTSRVQTVCCAGANKINGVFHFVYALHNIEVPTTRTIYGLLAQAEISTQAHFTIMMRWI